MAMFITRSVFELYFDLGFDSWFSILALLSGRSRQLAGSAFRLYARRH
jgi:hypothetical protein